MPGISAIFDRTASVRLDQLAFEDARLTEALNRRVLIKHAETPMEHGEKLRLKAVQAQYRDKFFQQFLTAADLDRHLAGRPKASPSMLPLTLQMEAQSLKNSMLPIAPDTAGTINSSGHRNFVFSYDSNAEALVTILRDKKHAEVYLSHIPGSNKGSPTNFIAEIAAQMRQELGGEYKAKNIDFYVHVPQEAATSREYVRRAEFVHPRFGAPRLKDGLGGSFVDIASIPVSVEAAFAKHYPDVKDRLNGITSSRYRAFQLAVQ